MTEQEQKTIADKKYNTQAPRVSDWFSDRLRGVARGPHRYGPLYGLATVLVPDDGMGNSTPTFVACSRLVRLGPEIHLAYLVGLRKVLDIEIAEMKKRGYGSQKPEKFWETIQARAAPLISR